MARSIKIWECSAKETNETRTVCKDKFGKVIPCGAEGDDSEITTATSRVKIKNPSCVAVEELIKEGKTPNIAPFSSGLFNRPVLDESPDFQFPDGHGGINHGDAYITMCSDMPADILSGFGRAGAKKATTIDVVVGRMASVNKGTGPEPGTKVGNSFSADAARIYISQLTKVDKNFGLAVTDKDPKTGGPKGHVGAAIGLKADAIRIIGREGIKIVTGKAQGVKLGPDGELNSRGGKIRKPAPPIELIAGNNIEPRTYPGGKFRKGKTKVNTLQPIVLGENTRDCIQDLGKIIDELASTVFNMALLQQTVNTALGITPLAHHAAAVGAAAPINLQAVISSLHSIRANKLTWEMNYVNQECRGFKYICSENIKAT